MHVGIMLGIRERQLSEDVVICRRELARAGTRFHIRVERVSRQITFDQIENFELKI
jgi:hypothetical protein